ncbi:C-C motif chemokine 18 [Macaca nemestrina]|uniref:C-C motif chemokine n=5 Tax=Cercopithecinae TaxID=9528 RepID=F6R6B9_MACMU|nr:C-C motif chemokine 18 [Macaca fascicularis]XP_011745604.1 C-C motif chemokine 18 [Macaca nemestrina]XP_025218473.1 C-C motif chemokine 18 [Theropithecus gelada]EHH24719.1 Small-inducible cytokine A18 [Macaca mulatta]
MKGLAAALLVLCTVALCSCAQVGTKKEFCCLVYTSRQIPQKFIVDYSETSPQCTKPGVILLTKRRRQICADPNKKWVQKYISDLKLIA